MMTGGMDSMMGWMMGIGLLGWVLVIALLVTIVVLLLRLLSRDRPGQPGPRDPDPPSRSSIRPPGWERWHLEPRVSLRKVGAKNATLSIIVGDPEDAEDAHAAARLYSPAPLSAYNWTTASRSKLDIFFSGLRVPDCRSAVRSSDTSRIFRSAMHALALRAASRPLSRRRLTSAGF
jgi:hypothetical protein